MFTLTLRNMSVPDLLLFAVCCCSGGFAYILWANGLRAEATATLIAIAFLRVLSIEGRYISVRRAVRLRKSAGFALAAVSVLLLMPDEPAFYLQFWFNLYIAALYIPLWFAWGVWLACEHWNLATLSERRLAELIKKHIADAGTLPPQTRLVVTVARESEVKAVPGLGTGAPGPVYVPEYIEVHGSTVDLRRWLLASASLPFGILPHLQHGEDVYVDGGVVDNAPILPALEAGCRDIVVVHTNANGVVNGQQITQHSGLTAHVSRCLRLRAAGVGQSFQFPAVQYAPPLETRHFEARVVHICPSAPPGSLLRSLLFGGRRLAQQLDELGYRDALAALKQLGIKPSN